MEEHKNSAISHVKKLPRVKHFAKKLFLTFLLGLVFLIFSLSIGILGYHYFFLLSWTDSLYNASMILTGMGPVDKAPDDSAKLFASFYAIYSGVAFLSIVAVILSPIAHRFLHKFRIDVEG
ncbi:MAG: hypothetical protein PSX36_10055 [bacterium]|nr:hypothetical protein [bacterium]